MTSDQQSTDGDLKIFEVCLPFTEVALMQQEIAPLWSKLAKRRGRLAAALLSALVAIGSSSSVNATHFNLSLQPELIFGEIAICGRYMSRPVFGAHIQNKVNEPCLMSNFPQGGIVVYTSNKSWKKCAAISTSDLLPPFFCVFDPNARNGRSNRAVNCFIGKQGYSGRWALFASEVRATKLPQLKILTLAVWEKIMMDLEVECWRPPVIVHREAKMTMTPVLVPSERTNQVDLHADPRPLIGNIGQMTDSYGSHGSFGGTGCEKEGGGQGRRSQNAQAKLPATQYDHLNGRLGAGLLGDKVVLLTLLGGGAAVVAGWGLATALIDSGRRRWFGGAVCVGFLLIGLTIWSWALYGSPWTYWKLWDAAFHGCWSRQNQCQASDIGCTVATLHIAGPSLPKKKERLIKHSGGGAGPA